MPPAEARSETFLTSSMDEYSPSGRTASVCEPLSQLTPAPEWRCCPRTELLTMDEIDQVASPAMSGKASWFPSPARSRENIQQTLRRPDALEAWLNLVSSAIDCERNRSLPQRLGNKPACGQCSIETQRSGRMRHPAAGSLPVQPCSLCKFGSFLTIISSIIHNKRMIGQHLYSRTRWTGACQTDPDPLPHALESFGYLLLDILRMAFSQLVSVKQPLPEPPWTAWKSTSSRFLNCKNKHTT